jgi:stage II sporulation protein R
MNKSIFYRILLVLLLLIVFVCFSAYFYVTAVSSGISDSVFRLHVIANSDSDEDQALKLKVRDSLLEYMNSLCSSTSSKEEAMRIANEHIDDFTKIAQDVIAQNGYDYSVDVSVGSCDFPTKEYGDVSLPAGTYDALRVKIGSASGHNWWCVMFPPLCFVDVSSGIVPDESKEILHDTMSDEEYDLVTSSDSDSELTFKFKLVEFFENFRLKLASN